MENTKKIIVLAGNHKEFVDFLKSNGVMEEEMQGYVYGSRKESLLGVDAEDVYIVGSFWQREDAGEMKELADSRMK